MEYRLSSNQSSIPRKGKIVSIGVLTSDKIVGISGGTWLYKSKHDVKRVEVVRSDGVTMVMNPNPQWVSLSKMEIVSFVEDCCTSDEEEDDEGERYGEDDDDGSTSTTTMFKSASKNVDTGAGNKPESQQEQQQSLRTNRSTKNKHERTSCGITGHSFYARSRQIKKTKEKLDQRRRTEKYLSWANNCNKAQYGFAMKIVNKLYRQCLKYGITTEFYRSKIFSVKTSAEFRKNKKWLENKVNYLKRNKAIHLNLLMNRIDFMDNPAYGLLGRSRETYRQRRNLEVQLYMEHRVMTMQLRTCDVCLENEFVFDKYDITTNLDDEDGSFDSPSKCNCCDKCKRNKMTVEEQLKMNMHPIWYERDLDGNIKTVVEDGEIREVVRYDVPEELKNLTMAEKLLIRRCSPFIPSVHIKDGVYGLNGHCVCFPQDIDTMCTDLPQTESNMVIFVRHIRNRDTNNSMRHKNHFKVDKNRVLSALRWLKVHHIGYKDITITESNLDWIKDGSVFDETTNHNIETKAPRARQAMKEGTETISENQCTTEQDPDEMEVEVIHPNYNNHEPNAHNTRIVKDLIETAVYTGQSHNVLEFPHIDHTNPIE